jgi:hypothetical protein
VRALGLGTAFVVPMSQPITDNFHFHLLADALQVGAHFLAFLAVFCLLSYCDYYSIGV